MRKNTFKIFVIMLLLFCISACTSGQSNDTKIEGTYYVSNGSIEIYGPYDVYNENLKDTDFVVKFYNENNYYFVYRNNVSSGTYSLNGGLIYFNNIHLEFPADLFELRLVDDKIEFRIEGNNNSFQIRTSGIISKGADVSDSYFNDKEKHEHNFSEFYSNGHNSCTEMSKEERICYICGLVEINEIYGQHNYIENVYQATCTEDGYTEHQCTNCGDSYKDNIVPASHNYITNEVPATCERDGYTEHICQLCGHSYKENFVSGEHNWQFAYVNEATCDNPAYTVYSCTTCNAEREEISGEALGHNWEIKTEEATCENSGYSFELCTRCWMENNRNEIPAKGHNYETTVIDPTCTVDGYTLHKCSTCNNEYTTDSVPAGCIWEETSRTESTCIEQGQVIFTCTRGNHTKTEFLDLAEHKYIEEIIEATCTSQGQVNEKCEVCEVSNVIEYIDYKPHDLGEDGICTSCLDHSAYIRLSYNSDTDSYFVTEVLNNTLTKLVIPSQYKGKEVTVINNIRMPSFNEIVIPNTIKGLYCDAENVSKITYLGTLKEWCEINFVNTISSRLFDEDSELYINNKLLTEITKEDDISVVNSSAFLDYSKLTSIVFADTLTDVKPGAFENCTSLTTIVFPKDFTKSANEVCTFPSCNNISYLEGDGKLISQIRSDSLKEVKIYGANTGVFSGSNIEKVTIMSEEIYFDDSAFNYCENLSEIYFDGITLGIGKYAFQYTNVKNFEIKGEIEEISDYAFYGSTLESIILPDSIKIIREKAFSNTLISEIDLKNVEVIEIKAFEQCNNLVEVIIPNSATNIESYIFNNCDNIVKITAPSLGTGSRFDMFASYSNIKEFVLTASDSIANSAFYNAPLLEKLTLPNTIERINENAFYYNTINELTFNGTIKEWCNIVFENNYSHPLAGSLDDNTFYVNGELLSHIGDDDEITNINDYALTNITTLQSIELSNEDITIGLVKNLKNLDRLVLPNSVDNAKITLSAEKTMSYVKCHTNGVANHTINAKVVEITGGETISHSFENTESLKLHSGVKTISSSSFITDNSKLYYPGTINDWANLTFTDSNNLISTANEVYFNEVLFDEINIPNTVTNINAYAFSNMKLSGKITISDTVQSIGLYAFSSCVNITELEWFDDGENKELEGYAFNACSKLDIVTLPENITYEFNSFNGTKATKVTAPYSLMGQFYSPKYYHILGRGVLPTIYNNSSSIEEVVIGSGYTEISEKSFNYSCKSLKKVTIPSSVKKIGRDSFTCNTDIYYEGNANTWCLIDFSDQSILYNTENLYINNKLVEEVEISGINKINANAFAGYKKLTKVVINSSVRTIGMAAFAGLENIVYLELPATLSKVENAAFANTNIEDVYYNGNVNQWVNIEFEDNIEYYGYLANNPISTCENFYINNVLLTEIDEISSDNLNSYAFYEYEKLERINKINVSSFIGSQVFYGCNDLIIDTLDISKDLSEESSHNIEAKITNLITSAKNGYIIQGTENITNVNVVSGKVINSYFLSVASQNIKTLIIGDTVETIEEGVFRYANLDSLQIGSSVAKISNNAFYDANIKELIFDGLVNSMASAFESANALVVKTVAENVNQIKYMHIDSLYVTEGSTLNLSIGSMTLLEIPETIKNVSVSGSDIQEIRFNGTVEQWSSIDVNLHPYLALSTGGKFLIDGEEISEVNISSNVTRIGVNAFAYMPIKSVTLASCVKEIDNSAFYYCPELTSVSLSEGITHIKDSAFYGCTKLEELNVPESLEFLSGNAFKNTKWINDLKADEISIEYGGLIYIHDFLYTVKKDLLTSDAVEIKEGTKAICSTAFSGVDNIKTVSIPSSVKEFGDFAFSSFKGKFNFPEKLEIIGRRAFTNGIDGDVVLPDSVKTIGDGAFYNCSGLKSVVLPSQLTELPAELFYNCGKLTDVVMGDNVKTIGDNAFRYCYWLKNINLSTNLERIGEKAFEFCIALKDIELPEGLLEISKYAFKDSAITKVTIPSAITEISEGAFQNTYELESVEILGNITAINDYAFEKNTKLVNINLPDTITIIGGAAFSNCANVQIEKLPANLVYIGASAFKNCLCFTELDLSKVDYIGGGAFSGNTNLSKVTLSNNLENLYGSTFKSTAIKEIYIPASVLTIQNTDFAYCSNLVSIIVDEDNPNYTSSFYGLNDAGIVTKDFTRIIRGAGAAEGYYGVTVPEVKYIDQYAYSGLQISIVEIPNKVEQIHSYAFDACSILSSIRYGSHDIDIKEEEISISIIDSTAFNGCNSLSEIIIYSSDKIDETIFTYNNNLKSLTKYYYSAVDTGIYGGRYWGYKNNILVRWDVDRWFE